jgi:hypothetical protein
LQKKQAFALSFLLFKPEGFRPGSITDFSPADVIRGFGAFTSETVLHKKPSRWPAGPF